MSNIEIKVEGFKEMQDHINKAVSGANSTYTKAMFKATSTVQSAARKNLYVGHGLKRGTLRRSIFTKVSALKGIIGVGEKYGPYVEYGTRPHTILPTRRKALAFKDKGGKLIFARSVRHPGTREIPFMRPAAEDSIGIINNIFREAIEVVVRKAAGK